MLWLLSSKTQRLLKSSKPCHVGIYWIALVEYCQMSTQVPRFQYFFKVFSHYFVLAKVPTSTIFRVKGWHSVVHTFANEKKRSPHCVGLPLSRAFLSPHNLLSTYKEQKKSIMLISIFTLL